jgi:hypothetical protein
MTEIAVIIVIREQRLEKWLAKKLGTKGASLADLSVANNVLEMFLADNDLGSRDMVSLTEHFDNRDYYIATVRGQGAEFARICRLLEQHLK